MECNFSDENHQFSQYHIMHVSRVSHLFLFVLNALKMKTMFKLS